MPGLRESYWPKDKRVACEKTVEVDMSTPEEMWRCQTVNCGYIYDPNRGDRKGKIPKGTRFEDLPDDWICPICGASKKMFRPLAGPGSVAAEST